MSNEDEALFAYLLNGKRPKLRRERGAQERQYTEVTDPSLLDPYERLFYDEDQGRSKEYLAVCAFYWSESFDYDEAAAWFALGAGYNDYALCAELKRAGVTPEIAGKEYVRGGVPTGTTVFQAVYTQQLTAADVAAMIERKRQREERKAS